MRSAEFFTLAIYTIRIVLSVLFPGFGQGVVLFVLCVWLIVQFFCHWYDTIFRAPSKRINGYNECFQNTDPIFLQSDSRIIPDL